MPYYEFQDGKWDEAYDVITCITNKDGIVQFPEYELVPRGWYDGNKLRGRVPQFTELEVSYENHTFWISKAQLEKIRKKTVKRSIELKRPDGFVPPIKIEIIS